MISDEMRELLSAYVDGELRDTDAARVEELSKRDAELRREIASYRNLRKKLKDWDEAEHGQAPPPTLARRALSRVEAWVLERREARRGRIVAALFHPLTAAAALLLAVGAGLLAEHAAPAATPPVPAARGIEIEPVAPLPGLTLQGSALRPYEEPAGDVYVGGFDEILRRRMNSWARLTVMLKEQEHWDRRRDRQEQAPVTVKTGEPRNLQLLAMLSTSEAVAKPFESLVLMRQPVVTGNLPAARALRAGTRIGMDQRSAGSLYVDLRTSRGTAVLAPLGEVWIGVRDGSRRTRVIKQSDWISQVQMVPIVWADEIAAPKKRSYDLEVQDFIVGPRARKLLLTSEAQDSAFRGWLKKNYGAGSLAQAFSRGARKRERVVARLAAALDRDRTATGFAFIDARGKLRGVELFADHALMMAFAPRLLRGYLLEAGEKGASLEVPSGNGSLLEQVEEFLETVPRGAARLEEIELDEARENEWPTGLKRVHVKRGGTIIGHGLVDADYRPVHVSIFE